jgi:ABC-type multidrug transport system fused ATPase/permease subunit
MILRGLLFQSTVFKAAMRLHVAILKRVLRFPASYAASHPIHPVSFLFSSFTIQFRFFDETPTGRILNRFSKDTAEIDELFPDCMNHASRRSLPSI